jgi:O-antigen ligase
LIHRLKDLIVVLALALVVFQLARPIALRLMSEADFVRRRNVWLALTMLAFLSPSFWLFVALGAPLVIWARRRDSHPIALYLLLLHVIPSMLIPIPTVGINQLFDMDSYRMLSFCILIPVAFQSRRGDKTGRITGLQSMDLFLLAFGVLQVALYTPPDLPNHVILPDSPTNALRRGLLFLVDVYALYFAVSRSCYDRAKIAEAMAAFCLGCAVMALVATFETARHWLLYADLHDWTDYSVRSYLERGGVLRAQASAGHSLVLGYLLAIAFGFWLYLQRCVASKRRRFAVALLFWLGLLAAYSRGPWVGALAIYLTFIALRPGAVGRMFKAAALFAVAFWIVSLTPLGDRIVKVLPFFGGSVDNANVVYRRQLAQRSWELIQAHPFFGDQLAYSKMEDLRQGQGIIDLVNTYAEVALSYGLIGLFLLVSFALAALLRAYRMVREATASDPDLALLGTSLVACILGTFLMLTDASFMLGYEKLFYVLAGLAAAYGHLRQVRPAADALPA